MQRHIVFFRPGEQVEDIFQRRTARIQQNPWHIFHRETKSPSSLTQSVCQVLGRLQELMAALIGTARHKSGAYGLGADFGGGSLWITPRHPLSTRDAVVNATLFTFNRISYVSFELMTSSFNAVLARSLPAKSIKLILLVFDICVSVPSNTSVYKMRQKIRILVRRKDSSWTT